VGPARHLPSGRAASPAPFRPGRGLLATGCTSGDGATLPASPAASSASHAALAEREPTTARGLAVAVLAHVDSAKVTHVSGLRPEEGVVEVFIDTNLPYARSIFVVVATPERAYSASRCGENHGYTEGRCSTDPFREVVRKKKDGGRSARYLGNTDGAERGSVHVQLFGADGGPASVSLVEDLLDDDLIGLTTSPDLNAQGEQLDGFRRLRLTIESEVRLDPDPPVVR
jgi:hypothetical protein